MTQPSAPREDGVHRMAAVVYLFSQYNYAEDWVTMGQHMAHAVTEAAQRLRDNARADVRDVIRTLGDGDLEGMVMECLEQKNEPGRTLADIIGIVR